MLRNTALAILLVALGFSAHAALGHGDFTATLGAVPPPKGHAMWLAGLGLMGFIALRRGR
jgi:hypothetical protein